MSRPNNGMSESARNPRTRTIGPLLTLAAAALAVGVLPGADCGTGVGTLDPTSTTDDPTASTVVSGLTVIHTGIPVHNGARIQAGDDLIAFGDESGSGVDYIIPSAGDTVGRGIPDGDLYNDHSFVVVGTKIVLTQPATLTLTVFDTATGLTTEIPESEIKLSGPPVDPRTGGHIVADGQFVVAISQVQNCCGATDDNRNIKLVDLGADEPVVSSFAVNPENIDNGVLATQVAIDADARQVVAVYWDAFYLYDMDDMSAEPTVFDMSGEGRIGESQVVLDDGYILYRDEGLDNSTGRGNTKVLDTRTATLTTLARNPSAHEVVADAGRFGYFAWADHSDALVSDNRAGIGTLPGPDALLAEPEVPIDGSTVNNGYYGYGATMSLTPDGLYWFIAGTGSVGSGAYIQVSTGGSFTTLADPTGQDKQGFCPGTDVHASRTLAAFKTGENTDTYLAYIALP